MLIVIFTIINQPLKSLIMKVTLRDQLLAFKEGRHLDSDGNSSMCHNFWDWFCKDSSLKNKSTRLFRLTKEVAQALAIDEDAHYVFFKNNCTGGGKLYDDLRICDIETGHVVWNFIPKCGHSGLAEIWGRKNDFKRAILKADTPSELIDKLKHMTTDQVCVDTDIAPGIDDESIHLL
jgi:hypothetical protein